MRRVALALTAIIILAFACGDDSTDAPAPAPTDTPLPAPTPPAAAVAVVPSRFSRSRPLLEPLRRPSWVSIPLGTVRQLPHARSVGVHDVYIRILSRSEENAIRRPSGDQR